jgi:hypothetical protein
VELPRRVMGVDDDANLSVECCVFIGISLEEKGRKPRPQPRPSPNNLNDKLIDCNHNKSALETDLKRS